MKRTTWIVVLLAALFLLPILTPTGAVALTGDNDDLYTASEENSVTLSPYGTEQSNQTSYGTAHYSAIKGEVGSEESSATIGVLCFSPAPGSYDEAPMVTLTALDGWNILYTTDGSDPGYYALNIDYLDYPIMELQGSIYSGPFTASSTVKARTFREINYWVDDSGLLIPLPSPQYEFSDIVEATYEFPQVLFDPTPGSYDEAPMVTLTALNGQNILYTTDGSDPGFDSMYHRLHGNIYSEPFMASGNIKARTYRMKNQVAGMVESNFEFSPIVEATYEFPKVLFDPAPGTYDEPPTVTLTALDGWQILYTTDGSDPGFDSMYLRLHGNIYSEPFMASGNIKARTYRMKNEGAGIFENDFEFSPIVEATYEFPKVLFDPAPGTYDEPPTVTLTALDGWQILYTTDGSDPGSYSIGLETFLTGNTYTGPFNATGTIKACTYQQAADESGLPLPFIEYAFSDIVEAVYVIGSGTQANPWRIERGGCPAELSSGWYEITGNITAAKRLTISGDVHLILGTGTTMNASQGINVSAGNSLEISGTGTLNAAGIRGCAGIGGGIGESAGTITINSGTVNTTGSVWGAGLGGGQGGSGGTITINGGTVTAQCYDPNDEEVGLAAGIGGGDLGSGGVITINGGNVYARGNRGTAGIGGGGYGSGGTITITGGYVTAIGASYPNGRSGAGIGAGRVRNNATVGDSGNITITGGTVIAIGGSNAQAIGGSCEVAENDAGKLTLGDDLMVTAGDSESTAAVAAGDPVAACRSPWVRIEPWTFPVFGPAAFTLPAALTTLEESAFDGMTEMTIVDASHCTSIGKWAFKGCTGLTQIRLPANCAIDPEAFNGCGTVFIFAPDGGSTKTYCQSNDNSCVFVKITEKN